jgi:hypothetical protein
VRSYTEAVRRFAAAHPIPHTFRTRWEQVDGRDVQRWLVQLLGRYSDAYASNQYRALRQFFRSLAEEEQLPDPMARLRAPKVTDKLAPVFTSGELPALEKACQGRTFAQRRDAAVIAVLSRRADRDPLRHRRPAAQRHRPAKPGDHRPGQGRQGTGRPDRPPSCPRPGPVGATSGSGPGTRRRGPRSYGSGCMPGVMTAHDIYQMIARLGR